MKKLLKALALTVGSATTTVAPLITVLSCSTNEPPKTIGDISIYFDVVGNISGIFIYIDNYVTHADEKSDTFNKGDVNGLDIDKLNSKIDGFFRIIHDSKNIELIRRFKKIVYHPEEDTIPIKEIMKKHTTDKKMLDELKRKFPKIFNVFKKLSRSELTKMIDLWNDADKTIEKNISLVYKGEVVSKYFGSHGDYAKTDILNIKNEPVDLSLEGIKNHFTSDIKEANTLWK